MRTLQEWADFTGWYVAQDGDGEVYLYSAKPYEYDCGFAYTIGNVEDKLYELPYQLVEPYHGDWKDSLHTPQVTCPECGGDGKISPRMWDELFCFKQCPTCHGTGKVNKEDV